MKTINFKYHGEDKNKEIKKEINVWCNFEDNLLINLNLNLLSTSSKELGKLNDFILKQVAKGEKIEFKLQNTDKESDVIKQIVKKVTEIYQKEYDEINAIINDAKLSNKK